MSDTPDADVPNGWVKAFHPSGLQVTLPVPVFDRPVDYAIAFRAVSAALEAGWLVTAPGLEKGEQKFSITACVRMEKDNAQGPPTPVIDLYEGDNKFKCLTVYLNRDEDVAAFEAASGLSLARMTRMPGSAHLERGKNRRDDDQFVAVAPRPFGVVWKDNPKWSEGLSEAEKKKVPKRKFVRWEGTAPAGGSSTPPADVGPARNPAHAFESRPVRWWSDQLKFGPTLALFNDMMRFFPPKGTPENAEVAELVKNHADYCGWEFDRDARQWVAKPAIGAYSNPDSIPF